MSQDKSKDELEQRVEQLEETVQRMMPNRRQTLKGMGLLGGGALLGGVGSRQADASTGSAGNVGSDTDRPDIYGDSVDANSVSTDNVSINNLAAVVEKTTDQSISASNDTKVDWDNELIDDNSLFDATNNEFSPSVAGDFLLQGSLLWSNISDQQKLEVKIYKNGSVFRRVQKYSTGSTSQSTPVAVHLSNLTTTDTVEVYLNSGSSCDIFGSDKFSYVSFVRQG